MKRIGIYVFMVLLLLLAGVRAATWPRESKPEAGSGLLVSTVLPLSTPVPQATEETQASSTLAPQPRQEEAIEVFMQEEETHQPLADTEKPPKGTYKLIVYQGSQSVVAYRRVGSRWAVSRIMICSTGTGSRTPNGSYHILNQYRYKGLYHARGQYASRIVDGILFHSVPIAEWADTQSDGKRMMSLRGYEKLGQKASHGCIRMLVSDAKWIYDNCAVGTSVTITREEGPYADTPPALIREAPYTTTKSYGWDPTDPDPENPYRQTPQGSEEAKAVSATGESPVSFPAQPAALFSLVQKRCFRLRSRI